MPRKGKGKKEEEKTIKKIIFCGLDNSGKSSYIARLKNQSFPSGPTMGVDRTQYDIFGFPILIWDFGGQKKLRKSHLKQTHFFHGTDLLFYLIDIQDEARYDESLSYFETLLEIFEEKPLIFILFHKTDPDIAESNKILQNIEEIKKRLKKPLKGFNVIYANTTIFEYVKVLGPFSMAISSLLPFASVLDSYIINFLEQQQLACIILMDKNGAILSKETGKQIDLKFCEITGTYLTQLFESYEHKGITIPKVSLQLPGEAAEIPAGIILFEQLEILKKRYYLTILTKKLDKIASLKESFEEFVQGLAKTLEFSK
ncbi:MAG: ADP-ribosylation factor-like protein [Promethearchaeota archaeon]